MRIIHTSDWHLGQHFINKSRVKEHQRFLAWLLEQVDEHQVDAIIVAGDVFDTGSPPSYARQLYNQFIVDLQSHQCQLVVLGGNHDSVATLNESTNLLACLNTYVVPSVAQQLEQQVIVLNDNTNQAGCVLCAIPFIRPRDVLTSKAGQSGEQKQQDLQQAIASHYQQVFDLAKAKADQYQPPLPIVATGHLTCVGATSSDSVREIYIGTLSAFPAASLPNADYIALGHIHQSQKVAGCEHIRYSGSPIALSFDEVGKSKTVNLVELNTQGGQVSVTPITVPIFQPMRQLKGDLAFIEQQLASLCDYDNNYPVWLDIEVDSSEYVTEFQSKIEAMCEPLPVEVLLLRRAKAVNKSAEVSYPEQATLRELNPLEVFEKCIDLQLDQQLIEQNDEQNNHGQQVHLARLKRVRTIFAQVAEHSEQQLQPLKVKISE